MMPFYRLGAFDYPTAMALATLLGVGFGFALERAGFSRSTLLAAQFYGRDMRVLKVMFTAIATSALGVGLFAALGLLDLSALKIPETFLWPQLLGGLLLGVGFIIAGYCPGTSVVATASGNLDGLVTFAGVGVGSLLFALAWPGLEGLYESGGLGVQTFPAILGLPWAVVAMLVLALALLSFVLAERIESFLRARDGSDAPTAGSRRLLRRLALGLGTVSVAALIGLLVSVPAARASEVRRSFEAWDLLDLAGALFEGPDTIYLVDLRAPERCEAGRIPGALCRPQDDAALADLIGGLPATRPLVLYDQEGLDHIPPAAAGFPGRIVLLEGGYGAWAHLAETAPSPPREATAEALARHRRLVALRAWMTGARTPVAPPKVTVKRVTRRVVKGGGC
jgi:rhodanese-related sulfurtransferase/uncharacterized membrane protein YedE/YeeE